MYGLEWAIMNENLSYSLGCLPLTDAWGFTYFLQFWGFRTFPPWFNEKLRSQCLVLFLLCFLLVIYNFFCNYPFLTNYCNFAAYLVLKTGGVVWDRCFQNLSIVILYYAMIVKHLRFDFSLVLMPSFVFLTFIFLFYRKCEIMVCPLWSIVRYIIYSIFYCFNA